MPTSKGTKSKSKASKTIEVQPSVSQLSPLVSKVDGWAIGVDLGAKSLRGAWVNTKGQLYDPIKWETKVSDGKEKVLNKMVQLVEELLKNPPADCDPDKDLRGIGFGIPGIIHMKKGVVIQSPHFPDWKRFSVYEKLRKKIKYPVFIDNDANVAALAEKIFGVCKSYDHFVYVTLGNGISGSLFLNGDIYHGSLGMAGECGHITVNPQGVPESTGNRGSVELYASGSGLERILADLKETKPEIDADSVEDLFELYKRGNKYEHHEAVAQVFDEMGEALGVMLANVVNTLDPQAICFSGELTNAWKAFSRKMIQITMERSYVARHNKLRILCTNLTKNSNFIETGVMGAASLVFLDAAKAVVEEEAEEAPKLKAVAGSKS